MVESNIDYVRAQESITGKIDRLVVTGHLAGQVRREHCEEFVHPYLRQIFDAFPDATFRLYHDGNLVPDDPITVITDTNCTVFMFGIEMDVAAQCLRGAACLIGNVPSIRVVQQLQPEQITRDCKDRLAVGAPAGSMLLCTAGGLSPGTPAAHIRAFAYAVDGIQGTGSEPTLT